MKPRMMAITALVVVLSLPLALHAQGTDPETVIKAMTTPLNAGDLDATMEFWASDAVMEVVHLDAAYTGVDEVRALFEMLLGKNFEMHIAEVLKVEGDKITTRTLMAMDDTRALGVQVVSTQVYVVQDGKIKSLWCSWSDETLTALAAASAQATDPVAVVMAVLEPMNAGDLDNLMPHYTEDVVVEVVHEDATYTGADEVRGLFEMLAGQNFEQHIDEVLSVEGDKVTTRTLMAMDDTRALGVQVVSTQVYIVQDGKIKSVRCDWSDETLTALAAAAEALPDTGVPVESGNPFPAQALLIVLGGLILLGSLGLALRSHHCQQRR